MQRTFVLAIVVAVTTVFASCDDGAASDSHDGSGPDTAPDTVADAASDLPQDPSADTPDPDEDAPDGSGEPDVDPDGTGDPDGEPRDADAADGSDDADPPAPFSRTYPPTEAMPAPEGMRWARSIVHLHSTHSHDACDDVPRLEDGSYNIPCMLSLRAALCDVRIDVAFLTDHPTHMDEVGFADLLLHVPETDTLVVTEDGPYANWIPCEDGHRVLVRVGAEDELMPVGLRRHVVEDQAERHEIMNAYTAEAAATMRDAGALIWVAHSEGRRVEDLRAIGIDGMEIYQLHANLDPRIRSGALGLDPLGPVTALFPLLNGTSPVPPDLAFLGFFEQNVPSLSKWAELLADGPVVGTGGTDAHENTFPGPASDGERLDSYRRMMSWFSNYLLVEGELGPDSAEQALGAGRVLVAFDVLGSPAGVDLWVDAGGRLEMGTTAGHVGTEVLRGTVPAPVGPSGITAGVQVLVLVAEGATWREVGRYPAGTIEHPLTEPGIYRVEARVTGAHLAPWLATTDWAGDEFPWLYSNAWRLGVD